MLDMLRRVAGKKLLFKGKIMPEKKKVWIVKYSLTEHSQAECLSEKEAKEFTDELDKAKGEGRGISYLVIEDTREVLTPVESLVADLPENRVQQLKRYAEKHGLGSELEAMEHMLDASEDEYEQRRVESDDNSES
jgi:hypothetical protein